MSRFPYVLAAAALMAAVVPSIAYGSPAIEPVAVSGMAAPGTAYNFSTVSNDFGFSGGHLAFIANTTGPGPSNHGIWGDHGGGAVLEVLDKDLVPGAPGSIFAPDGVAIDDSGSIVFRTMGLSGFSIIRKSGGVLSAVSLGGAPAPGGAGNFGICGQGLISGGLVAFQSGLSDPTSNGIFTDAFSGALENIALVGGAAPGGGVYRSIGDSVVFGGGMIVHMPSIEVDGVARSSIVAHTASGASLAARAGSAAAGVPGSDYFMIFQPAVNALGHLAFPSILSNFRDALMADFGGGLSPVLLDGQAAPDTGGGMFAGFSKVDLNDGGRMAIVASADLPGGGAREGLWSDGRTGSLSLVAMVGAAAPELAGKMLSGFDSIAISDTGLTAFIASVSQEDRSFQQALYVQDASGELSLVAGEGEPFEILPGQWAIVKDVRFNGNSDRSNQSFQGNVLAFQLQFDDGRTGIYKATVPEPGTLSLLTLASLGVLRRRKTLSSLAVPPRAAAQAKPKPGKAVSQHMP